MPEKQPKLEAYLEEISHFLSGRAEREEILSEIRSHILEKAATEHGAIDEAALDKAIAAYGEPRRVAERYAEDQPIIAPAYKRYLFRYTSILFAVHLLLTVVAVAFRKSFVIFPFLYMPEMGVIDALMYVPMAFLADLGAVALVLYFVTQSRKDVKLPWPRFGADLDEFKPAKGFWAGRFATAVGAVIMLALTDLALYILSKYGTIFLYFENLKESRDPIPLFTPGAGRRLSLIVIAMLAAATMKLFIRLFTRSRWVDVVSNAVSLTLIGLLLRQPFDGLFVPEILSRFSPRFVDWAEHTLLILLLFIALMVTIDLVKNLVAIGRKKWGT